MSESGNPFVHSPAFIVDRQVSFGFINKEFHLRPPFQARCNDTTNQAKQSNAGTADTNAAHTNAEKAKEA
jgi:hypothetical protein